MNSKEQELEKEDIEIIEQYRKEGKLHPDFEPFTTYDLVQAGYPVPNHGVMVARAFGGTNKDGLLLPAKGMYCKVEDVLKLLSTPPVSSVEEKCEHLPLVDTGVGYYHCPACNQGFTYDEWNKGVRSNTPSLSVEEAAREYAKGNDNIQHRYEELQPLFNLISESGGTPLISEIEDIITLVHKKYPNNELTNTYEVENLRKALVWAISELEHFNHEIQDQRIEANIEGAKAALQSTNAMQHTGGEEMKAYLKKQIEKYSQFKGQELRKEVRIAYDMTVTELEMFIEKFLSTPSPVQPSSNVVSEECKHLNKYILENFEIIRCRDCGKEF